MRSIILGVAVSLDGYIEGPAGEYDWCFTDQDYGMQAFFNRIDALFIGRKTYEMAAGSEQWAGSNPFAHYSKYVFSNSLRQLKPGFTLVSGNIAEQVKQIKEEKGKDIWLFGGAALTSSLMNAGLVDELWLSIHPVILGAGKPLFQHLLKRIYLQLQSSKTYDTGLVQAIYKIDHQR